MSLCVDSLHLPCLYQGQRMLMDMSDLKHIFSRVLVLTFPFNGEYALDSKI